MDALLQDIRYAARMLVKHRGFTAIAVLTLGLGIGANAAIFSVLDAVILRPLGYPDIDRVMIVGEAHRGGGAMSVAWPNYLDWREQNRVFDALGVYRGAVATLTGGDQPERLNASIVSSEVFKAIGIDPLAGSVFSADEDRQGGGRVALVSERLWRSHFSSDPNILGRVLQIDSQPYTVVGVMPASMRFPSRLTDIGCRLAPWCRRFRRAAAIPA
jgi:putative ABC transport system permease protein